MISFENDYSEGTSKEILDELIKENYTQVTGYGLDKYSKKAISILKKEIGNNNVDIHFIPGGTPCNILVASLLKDYEGIICANTGHINVHETGAIENTGHKCLSIDTLDGKLTPKLIKEVYDKHTDEHMVKPAMVFVSNTTELGTVYKKKEIKEIADICKKLKLYLYLDGARIGSALTSKSNDLTLKDICNYTDMFYIGGTKNGALLGEAMVIKNNDLKKDFRYLLKNKGFMLAKNRTIAISFYKLFENDLYYKNAKHANDMANKLINCFNSTKTKYVVKPESNQIFIIVNNDILKKLSKKYLFSIWNKVDNKHTAIRLVTSWATKEESIETFINDYKNIA